MRTARAMVRLRVHGWQTRGHGLIRLFAGSGFERARRAKRSTDQTLKLLGEAAKCSAPGGDTEPSSLGIARPPQGIRSVAREHA